MVKDVTVGTSVSSNELVQCVPQNQFFEGGHGGIEQNHLCWLGM